jgi:hypothetical protein
MPLATERPLIRIILAYNALRLSGYRSARWCLYERTHL